MRSWFTLLRLIWSSGLNAWLSSVRRHVSQSLGSGFHSISSVTGTNGFCGDCACWAVAGSVVATTQASRTARYLINLLSGWARGGTSSHNYLLAAPDGRARIIAPLHQGVPPCPTPP